MQILLLWTIYCRWKEHTNITCAWSQLFIQSNKDQIYYVNLSPSGPSLWTGEKHQQVAGLKNLLSSTMLLQVVVARQLCQVVNNWCSAHAWPLALAALDLEGQVLAGGRLPGLGGAGQSSAGLLQVLRHLQSCRTWGRAASVMWFFGSEIVPEIIQGAS